MGPYQRQLPLQISPTSGFVSSCIQLLPRLNVWRSLLIRLGPYQPTTIKFLLSDLFKMVDQVKYRSKLEGAHVLIIGGTSGLGFCVAEACLEAGARVTVSSSRSSSVESALSRLAKSYPSTKGRVTGHTCDLASEEVEANIVELLEKTGNVDHIVCTAGDKLDTTPVTETSLAIIRKVGMVRFVAPLLLAKHAPKWMKRGPASSITLSTGTVAEKPIPNWAVIASYASGMYGMARGLAADLAPIRVNAVCPGAVHTELWGEMSPEKTAEIRKRFASQGLTGEPGEPEDVAEAYMYCLRDRNLTGSILRTDSGSVIKGMD